jgi:tripartite-type tricarboxylate transporter receptor subunit TctC
MLKNRITWLVVLTIVIFCTQAFAQSYPNKTVRLVVPYSPGGSPDVFARVIGQRLTQSLGQSFVVENRPGAGGISACEMVAKAEPDGYTLLVPDIAQLAINPHLFNKLYDSVKSFAPSA